MVPIHKHDYLAKNAICLVLAAKMVELFLKHSILEVEKHRSRILNNVPIDVRNEFETLAIARLFAKTN